MGGKRKSKNRSTGVGSPRRREVGSPRRREQGFTPNVATPPSQRSNGVAAGMRKSKHKGSPGKATFVPVAGNNTLESLKVSMKKCITFNGKPKENPLYVFLSTENATRKEGWLLKLGSLEASPRNQSLSEAQKLLLSNQYSILPKDVGLISYAWGLNSRSIKRNISTTIDEIFSSMLPEAGSSEEDSRLVLSPVPDHLARRKRVDKKRTPVLGDISNSNRNPQFAGGNKQRELFAIEETNRIPKESKSRIDAACQTTVIQVDNTCQTSLRLVNASCQTMDSIGQEFQEELQAGNPSFKLQGFVIQTMDVLAKKQSSTDLVRLSGDSRTRRLYFRIPWSRPASSGNYTDVVVRRKSKSVQSFLESFGLGDTNLAQQVLTHALATKYNLSVIKNSEAKLQINEMTVLRDRIPTTTRGIERAANALVDMRPQLFGSLFPSRLRKQISDYESHSLPIDLAVEMQKLEMGGEKKEMKLCLHAWVKNPQVVIEGLVRGALVSHSFEESEVFSNHRGKVMVCQGSDKGGNATLNLVRVLNRHKGNTPDYCYALAFYEDARECYENLKKTIFNPRKPTQPFLQQMLYGRYYMVVASVVVGCEDSEQQVCDAQCIMLEITDDNTKETGDATMDQFDISVALRDNQVVDFAQALITDDQDMPSCINLEGSGRQKTIGAALCVSPRTNDVTTVSSLTGIRLFESPQSNVPLHEAEFTNPMEIPKAKHKVEARCYGVYCYTADDLKLNICVAGQGTASSACSCPICIAPSSQFAASIKSDSGVGHPLREGEYSNDKLHKTFKEKAGERATAIASKSDKASMELKKSVCSVVNEPLLLTPPKFNTGALMHCPQGAMTHLTKLIFEKLKVIDRDAAWMKTLVDEVLPDAEETVPFATAKIKELSKADNRYIRDIESARDMYPNTVGQLVEERQQHAKREGLSAWFDVKNAATELLEAGKKFIKDSGIKSEGEASYLFLESYQTDGGVLFRKENSGLELTNRDCLKVLSKHDKISNRVKLAYRENAVLRARVVEVMDEHWTPLATPLFDVSKRMKSQRPTSEKDIATYKTNVIKYTKQWQKSHKYASKDEETEKLNNKHHQMLVHVDEFMKCHGMGGRASEEGFEATHPDFSNISTTLNRMVSTKARANKIMQRFGLGLKDDYQTLSTQMKEGRKTKKRGSYSKENRKSKLLDSSAPIAINTNTEDLPEGLVYASTRDVVVKRKWLPYYNHLCGGRVPSQWSAAFADDEELGSIAKVKAEFLHNT